MVVQENPEPSPSHRHTKSLGTCRTVTSEKDLKTNVTACLQKGHESHQDDQERQKHSVTENLTQGAASHNQEGSHKYGASS